MDKLFWVLMLLAFPLYGTPLIDLSGTGTALQQDQKKVILLSSKGDQLKKWSTFFHSHGTHRTPAGQAAKKYSTYTWTPAGIKFTTSTKLAELKAPNGAYLYFSARILTTVNLTPDMAGQILNYRFKIRGKRYDAPTQNHFFSTVLFSGMKKPVSHNIRPAVTTAFSDHKVSRKIPAGAKKAVIAMAVYGCGELEISEAEISVSPVGRKQADVIVTSTGFIDGQFHLPAGKHFPLYLIFKRNSKERFKKAEVEIILPPGYSVTGSTRALRLPGKVNKGKFSLNVLQGLHRTISDGRFCPWRPQMLLLFSERQPGNQFHEMKYTLIVDGKRQNTRTLKLKTCPFEKARTPRIIGSGLQFPFGHDVDRNTAELLAETVLACGYNIWADNSSKELADIMKSKNIPRISSPYQLRNGFHIQGAVPLSGNDRFLDIYGKFVPRHICPVSVYKKSAYYKGPVEEMIAQAVGPQGKLDSILTNWEPYALDYKGCFCSRCGDEFAAFMKIPVEKIRQEWPGKIIGKYGKKWVDFRSWQHGQVVRTLAASIRKLGAADRGKRSYFIPEISSYGFNDFMSERHTAQYHAKHYLDGLERICVWGPYTYKAGINTPYLYTPGHHLGYFLTSRGVDRFIRKYSAKTRIHALPHGSHCGWVSTPESIVFDTLCSIVHNAVQSTPYWFYYDYRYHREMARMNSLIAEYEKELTSWPKNSAVTIRPTTPVITAKHWKGAFTGTTTANMYPEIFTEKAVQVYRWTRGRKNLAAVANLWEKEAVFAKIAFPDIRSGKWILSSAYPRTYQVCTATELRQGVELYIPALSWRFFRLLPFAENLAEGRKITAAETARLKEKLLPKLKKSFEAEEKLLSSRTDDFPEYDFGAMPEIRSGEVSVSGSRFKGAQAVAVKTPWYTALLDPEKGGRLQSFKAGSKEIVNAGLETGLGVPGCWAPVRSTIPRRMQLCAITPEKGGVSVKLRRSADSRTPFDWEISYFFAPREFRQHFTIINTAKKAQKVIPRFHNMLKEPARDNPVSFIMGDVKMKLPLESSVARVAPRNAEADKLFNVKIFRQGHNRVLFPRSGVKFSADHLYAYYFWNSPGAAAASFEPTFMPVLLQPGKRVTVTQKWELIR